MYKQITRKVRRYHQGPVVLTWINLTRKTNHIHDKMWDEITYPCQNFNGATVEVLEWISNFISHFIMAVITYPCLHQSWFMLVNGVPELLHTKKTAIYHVNNSYTYNLHISGSAQSPGNSQWSYHNSMRSHLHVDLSKQASKMTYFSLSFMQIW